MLVLRRSLERPMLGSNETDSRRSPRTALPALAHAEPIAGPPPRPGSQDRGNESEDGEKGRDDALIRLGRCALSIKEPGPGKQVESRLLSHWEVGVDPAGYTWSFTDRKSNAGGSSRRLRESR